MFKIFSLLLILFILILPMVVDANIPPPGPTSIQNPISATSFDQLAEAIIDWVAAIGISISVVVIIYAGFLFMTAGGVEDKITRARKTLIWALVGLAILIMGRNFIALVRSILSP